MPQVMHISEEEETQLLKEQAEVVKTEANNMKRCFDQSKMTDGLKHASNLLNELRTSVLSPKSYYTLYMLVTEQLRCFEQFIIEDHARGHKVSDLYELVQYCGNIIPRLYLLVTVGSAFIKIKLLSKREVLRDLVEMCRGVQHPLRGLFLRKYLLEMTKNLLPDAVEGSSTEGNVHDAVEFALLNFAETNKLWVRMQHLGHSRERDRREQERRDLKLVVGSNLMVLSNLESVTTEMYSRQMLPALLEQIVNCRDAIAQEYLMECLIQVFPDEFQLETLDQFLRSCSELQTNVNVKHIVIQLITRLANFAKQGSTSGVPAIPEHINLFQIFSENIAEIIASHPNMPLEGVVQLQSALLDLALSCYPDRADLIDTVLHTTHSSLGAQLLAGKSDVTPETCDVKVEFSTPAGRELVKLLRAIVDHYHGKILSLLAFTNFAPVVNWLDFPARRQVLLYVVNQALEASESLQTPDHVQKALSLLNSLILGVQSVKSIRASSITSDPEDVHEEQTSIGRFLHLINPTNEETGSEGISRLDQHFLMLSDAKKILFTKGAPHERLQFTLPPLIFQAIRLAHQYVASRESDSQWEPKVEKIFKFVHSLCVGIAQAEPLAELALRLFLSAGVAVDRLGSEFGNREKIAYEFYTQAFSIYEEEISDSRAQQAALSLLIGALEQMSCFTAENHEPLRTKAAQAATKLLKKPDQTRAVGQCAHLFWSAQVLSENGTAEPLREGKRVAECLKRGLKIASQSMDDLLTVQLHVELLGHFVFFRQQGCQEIKPAMLSQLAVKILEGLEPIGDREEAVATRRHFDCLAAFIRNRIDEGDSEFAEVSV